MLACILAMAMPQPALTNTAGDRLARFGGAGATELHQAVAAAVAVGRFRHPPIQIGSQLSLADDRCARCFGPAVHARTVGVKCGWWGPGLAAHGGG